MSTNIDRRSFIKKGVGAGIAAGVAPAFIKPVHAANVSYRTLGKSGIKVSSIGLGASRITEPSLLKSVLGMGVNFLDTGRMYARGKNEDMIGRVIKDMRKDLVIQSKMDQKIQDDTNAMNRSIEDSLKALRTDYIDIMLVRGATTAERVNNHTVWDVFRKAKESGKIRLCGFSAHSANAPEMIRAGVDAGVYDVILVPYNHNGSFTHSIYGIYSEWDRDALESSIEYAAKKDVTIIAMKTCSGGPLKQEGEARGTYREALKWILKNKNIATSIPAIASFREAEQNIGAMG